MQETSFVAWLTRVAYNSREPVKHKEDNVNNLSLKWKILLSVTITCIVAVIVTTFVTVRSGIAAVEETIVDDARTLAEVLGEASVGAITFNDDMTVTASLNALNVSERVTSAAIYTEGKVFARFTRQGHSSGLPERPNAAGIIETPTGLILTEII